MTISNRLPLIIRTPGGGWSYLNGYHPAPFPAHASVRQRQAFNAEAKAGKAGITWSGPNEVTLNAKAVKLYAFGKQSLHAFHADFVNDVRAIMRDTEAKRREVVRQSAAFHDWLPYRAPLERLSPVELLAVKHLAATVKPIIDRIEARQHDPNADVLARCMKDNGDESGKLFARFRRDTLAGPFEGSLFTFFPDQSPINGMIAPDISMEEFMQLGATLPKDAEPLRPTTVLTKDAEGRIVATPLPLHPAFREDHLALAHALKRIAGLQVEGEVLDPKLQDQLRKWARFFQTGAAADERAAAQATIDAGEGGGNLRVHVGPSESYLRDNTKFPYLFAVGVRDEALKMQAAAEAWAFPLIEAMLEGVPHYRPRPLSARGGFADPIYQAVIGGFLETYAGAEVGGYNYPNYDGYGVEGSNRFIVLEWVERFSDQVQQSLGRLLDEDIEAWDALAAVRSFIIDHESGHLLGPQRSHVTPGGLRMGAVFGDHWGSADEPKADMTVLLKVGLMLKHGVIEDAEVADRIRPVIGASLSHRYRGKAAFAAGKLHDHLYGHMVHAGHLFKTGTLSLVDVNGPAGPARRLHVDYRRLLETGSAFWRKIVEYQAAGDLDGYLAFGSDCVAAIPDEADRMILAANKDIRPFFLQRPPKI